MPKDTTHGPPVRLEPTTPQSRVKHSTTEPLRFYVCTLFFYVPVHEILVLILYMGKSVELDFGESYQFVGSQIAYLNISNCHISVA